jgi:short subunit dehydrogenase-like uncharacterized protein
VSNQREFGIIVYGATGYTGKLVCEYLHAQYGTDSDVKWAMAGRSLEKLEAVRADLGISEAVPLVVADASSLDSIESLASRTKVVLTTVGPYQLYGSDLVAACAKAGTDYVDLCGEPAWMHEMIAAHGDAAKASGARIVFSCGFDSVPFDLGILFLQEAAQTQLGAVATRVKGRVRTMKGFKATMAAAGKDRSLIAILMNPFSLTEGFTGPEQPPGTAPQYDEALESWAAPFVMATINTKNIHRSNYLLSHQYGEDFVYDEMMLTGPGEQGEAMANAVAADTSMAEDTTQPGEGPTKEERENGRYDVLFVGTTADGQSIRASVQGELDPGYGSTSRMIAESAICLLLNPELASGGIWTPASALGTPLISRLQEYAGLTFKLES